MSEAGNSRARHRELGPADPIRRPARLAPPPHATRIGSSCLMGDEHAGQCRAARLGPGFTPLAHLAPPPVLIDSSPLTRFMGVGTFVSAASNWSAAPLAAAPGLGPHGYGSGVKDKG